MARVYNYCKTRYSGEKLPSKTYLRFIIWAVLRDSIPMYLYK